MRSKAWLAARQSFLRTLRSQKHNFIQWVHNLGTPALPAAMTCADDAGAVTTGAAGVESSGNASEDTIVLVVTESSAGAASWRSEECCGTCGVLICDAKQGSRDRCRHIGFSQICNQVNETTCKDTLHTCTCGRTAGCLTGTGAEAGARVALITLAAAVVFGAAAVVVLAAGFGTSTAAFVAGTDTSESTHPNNFRLS